MVAGQAGKGERKVGTGRKCFQDGGSGSTEYCESSGKAIPPSLSTEKVTLSAQPMHERKLFLSAGRFGPSFSHYSWSTVHYARCRRSKNFVASQAFSGNFSVDQKDL